ncbi:MAG: cytochrome c biogenesis protein CcsA [Bacteroidetes bacterium]|nr:cytochrome c biogenesis protein CcsA [Bacteroidota bacterium]
MNSLIGDIGHFLVIVSFITSLMATYTFFKGSAADEISRRQWMSYARYVFGIHFIAVIGVIISLFIIIYNHNFEYHYAYSHSSRNLPVYYIISCFWEGQEGSFLLWIFWQALLGVIIIKTNRIWQGPVMTVFSFVQAFLTSMILGVVIPGLSLKIGSDPFILLRDASSAPIFQMNPEFIPEDGTGLNPLLQNYWMVIHPPTLFLGFAATLVPFAYCIAGLWQKKYREWIRPALPWTLFAAMVLGVGILMGGYWAYETLSFGGYWNWDPVENAVYVPWLLLLASYHTMIAYGKSNTALKSSIILVITTFLVILYSTFLTRSGILGDSSVHSFTDLGLSGQLLLYLMVFLLMSLFLIVKTWNKIPTNEEEVSVYSREFWIFIGVTTLCLMGFQVLVPTSIPVFNSVIELFGGSSNMAPPADQIDFYSKFQIWFAILVALLSGTGQFFWWKKMNREALREAMIYPIIISLLISSGAILIFDVSKLGYMFLMTAGIYTIVANGKIFLGIFKNNWNLTGGSIAHIGIGMILIGILFSSGYSKIISLNRTGVRLFENSTEEMDRENLLLWINEPRQMDQYILVYKGAQLETKNTSFYISKKDVFSTPDPNKVVAERPIFHNQLKYYDTGDTIEIYPENTYYEVEYRNTNGGNFFLYPRAQINPQMGGLLASPDIKRFWGKDLYTHISAGPDPEQDPEWSENKEYVIKIDEQFSVDDVTMVLTKVERVFDIPGIELLAGDVAIKAHLTANEGAQEYEIQPLYIIKDRFVGRPAVILEELGLRVIFWNVQPETNSFSFRVNTSQKDYIVLKAIEKPFINILWIGTLVLVVGFIIAIRRRYNDFSRMKAKGLE